MNKKLLDIKAHRPQRPKMRKRSIRWSYIYQKPNQEMAKAIRELIEYAKTLDKTEYATYEDIFGDEENDK